MKVIYTILAIIVSMSLFVSCGDKDNDDWGKDLTDDEYTNHWIYDKMKRVYLWNEDLSSANYTQNPETFFYNILYKYGKREGDRFSWIEEDKSKEKSLFGDDNLGFDYIPMSYFPYINPTGTTYTSIGFFVIYVHKGSDAEAKGLKRGMVIYEVNNQDITADNYRTIMDEGSLTLSVYNNDGVQETLQTINTNGAAQSPIFLSEVLTVKNSSNNDIKVGYLVYNSFQRDPDEDDNKNFRYDIALIESINDLHSQGITEFVLDLRYNPGGYLTSAIDLASALYPDRSTDKIFAREKYNKYFEDSLLVRSNKDPKIFIDNFLDKVYGTNVSIPKLNINRVFIIASEYSASASELVIHNLRPHMNVHHIGEVTVGKDKASMTLKADSERIKWQYQPLISRLTDTNGDGNYIDGLTPDYPVSEWEESFYMQKAQYQDGTETQCPLLSEWRGGLKPLGDLSEPMLAEAISIITNVPRAKSAKTAVSKTTVPIVKVPYLKYNEDKQRIIIDSDKFDNY